MEKKILVLPGDGIGPEVTQAACKIFDWYNQHTGHRFILEEGLIGGTAFDQTGTPLPDEVLTAAKESDSILLGAVGGPQWGTVPFNHRPEKALLKIRQELDLFANLRPASLFSALIDASPLKPDIIDQLDLMIVRELNADVYFGTPRGIEEKNGMRIAFNTMSYSTHEIERIACVAFELAKKRHKKVCSIDKANVLESSQLWRETVQMLRDTQYQDIALSHMYVDNAAMQLVYNPKQFDVLLTSNLFGDILSDEAAMLTGSLGMLPSASLGDQYSLYEPIHGSAPDIAGQNIANPLGAILSVAMMFQYTFELPQESEQIIQAVEKTLGQGFRTKDILSRGCHLVSTSEMGDKVIAHL